VNKGSGHASTRAGLGRAGRSIGIATRWAAICWTAVMFLTLACLIDIMGLGSALVGVGIYWLVGMSGIVMAALIARLALWVGLDVCDGLRREAVSLIPRWNAGRWFSGRCRNSGVWDEWLDDPIPGPLQRWDSS
jgi:hypothetical protein